MRLVRIDSPFPCAIGAFVTIQGTIMRLRTIGLISTLVLGLLVRPLPAEARFAPSTIEDHLFLQALNDLPIDPSITAHSIIAVLGEGPITGKTDGVIAYESAHIDGVESEKVVRSGHSTQSHPETIEEVHRILSEHLRGVRKLQK